MQKKDSSKSVLIDRMDGNLHALVYKKVDDNPDLSYLGKYSDKPEKVHIDRLKQGKLERSESRYFNAGCGDPDYIKQDYRRMQAYNRGDWHMVAVCCEISVKTATNWAVDAVVARSSVWGVESDSKASYFLELAEEQISEAEHDLENLKAALTKINLYKGELDR